jgi:hypothetical protein
VVKESGMVNALFVKEAFCSKLTAGAIFFRSAVKVPPLRGEARPPNQSPLGFQNRNSFIVPDPPHEEFQFIMPGPHGMKVVPSTSAVVPRANRVSRNG